MSRKNLRNLQKLEHIDIEITRKCNFNCFHCSAGIERGGPKLSKDDVKNILCEAKSLGLKRVGFTGGEPFLSFQSLQELTDFSIQELGTKIHIHSNGSLITPEIAKWVKQSNIDMTITVFGPSPEVHELITQLRGSYNSTLNGLQNLLNYKVVFSVFIVPMKANIREIPSLIKFVNDMGCKDIRILSLSPTGKALTNFIKYAPSQREIDHLNKEFIEIQNQLNISLNAGFCTRLNHPSLKIREGHDYCYSAQNRVHIDGFGNVFPCTAASGRLGFSAGNLMIPETNLSEIWQHSPLFKYIRKNLSNPDTKCQKCIKYKDCMGGCRVMMAYKYGDFSVSNPECGGPY